MTDRVAESRSFEEIAVELSPALARYLRRQATDGAQAEDLLQETLIRIARGLPNFDGRSTVRTWAFAIATRVAIDHFRKRAGAPPIADLSEAESLPDDAPAPDQGIAIEQMNGCVRQVLESLPDEYREAVMLHDFGGLSAREIAEARGCSIATAKIRIHRGRVRLKEALERKCEFYREADNVLRCHPKTEKSA